MKQSDLINLNDFIFCDYIDNDLCDKLISWHLNGGGAKKGVININGKQVVEESIKKSIDSLLFNSPYVDQYMNQLQKVVDKYIEKYPYCNTAAAWNIIDGVNIQQYEPNGGYYKWHSERPNTNRIVSTRHLVFTTYLNDVTDDGETEFYHQKLKIKPEKGLTVIFPPDWTFTHRGIPSKTQEKFIVTGWFNYLD